nr:integrase, catalytic region, zinc finger, CCHC-type, peptidase aspartic, catalytic [Tanacetum cinerariifolium]
MRTRSKSYPINSTATIPRRSNRRRIPNIVEPGIRTIEEIVPMANRTMEELLQAPTEGYGEAIVILEILAEIFEIKTNLLQLVQANKFHGFERDNPHTHISNFKRMTVTLKYRDVPNDAIKLMLFPYSLEGAARIWYEKEPPNSILTWDDLDSLNAAAGGNLLNKTTREALKIIKNKSNVRYSRSKSNVSRVNTNTRDSVSKTDDRIDNLADQISNLVEIVNKQVITPASAKAVEKTCGGAHAYYDCIATDSNQPSVCAATDSYNQVSPPNRASHQIPPPGFAPVQNNPNRYNQGQGNYFNQANNFNQENNFNRGNNFQNNQGYRTQMNNAPNFQNQGFQNQPFSVPNNQIQPGIPNEFSSYMKSNEIMIKSMENQINILRGNFNKQEENLRRNLNNDMRSILGSFFQNQASTSGTLPSNIVPNPKDEMKAVTTRSGLAYEGPSIPANSPLERTNPPRMTLELADRSITRPKGVTEDVFVKVGKFYFPTDFVVVDFEADLRVPLILGRSFLRTGRALIDVYREEITLRYNPKSSNPTLVSDPRIPENDFCKEPIVKSSSPTLTSFGETEETKATSSIEEPPELELKELPSHLEYAFLEESNKLPVIIAKDLKDVEKEALINEDYKPAVQSQRMVNLKIHDVIKKEVIKLLDAGYFQIPIDPQDQEKITFTCPYGTFAYRHMPFGLCNAPGNVCPLTRIATPTIVPHREPIPIVNSIDKPVVTLVYTRKPKPANKKVPNKLEPNNSWGSSSSNVPSSLLTYRLSKSSSNTWTPIMGYGDYQIGKVTISRVYYMEGLGHNLFFVGQFCDSDLKVAFRQHSCFICNLEGVDLLTGSQGNNLYTLSLQDMMASAPICLLSKASKTKSCLWHRRLSHLNFGAINHLARQGLVRGLPKLKFEKDHLCSACAMGKSTKKTHKP